MSLTTRLQKGTTGVIRRQRSKTQVLDESTYERAKSLVHGKLVESMDLTAFTEMPREALAAAIREALHGILQSERIPLNREERGRLVGDLMNEILGLGPIEALMQDEDVQDILINGYGHVFVEKRGVLHQTPIRFRDDKHLMQVVDKIVSKVGRRVDESSPMVDARLPDGSRVNVIIPPVALDGPLVSIRKFGKERITIENLLGSLSLTDEIFAYLKAAIRTKLNVLISGGTGAGKTTLLNILSGCIPINERIVTIEDSAELSLNQTHVARLESRPPNIESRGEVSLTDLVKNSLRMRPDRIIVGETRGAEVLDMLQAMNTGHPGSMSTIHANTPRDAFARMEVMIGMAPSILSEKGSRALIASAINVIVQIARLPDGARRVISVSEVTGIENDAVVAQDVFCFRQEGVSEDGRIHGRFVATKVPSRYAEHFRTHGVEWSDSVFALDREVS
jgi:pilus assembly protein CpaF